MTDDHLPPTPPAPRYSDGDGSDGYDMLGSPHPFAFVRIPELAKKIRGATPFFFLDLENGEIFSINIDSTGRIRNCNIEECFGLKHKADVIKLVPKGDEDATSD